MSVTLLKSTFKLQAISARYYLLAMEGKMFDIRLILKFSGAATDMPIVEWVEKCGTCVRALRYEECRVRPVIEIARGSFSHIQAT